MGTRRYWRGIGYEELEGSPTFSCTRDSMTATQIVKIAWDDIDTLLDALFPAVLIRGSDKWYYLTLPSYPRKSWLRVDTCNVEPFDPENPEWAGADNANRYAAGAKVTITYKTDKRDEEKDDDDEDNQTIRSHRVSFGGEMLKLAQHGFYWPDGIVNNPIDQEDVNVAKIIPTIEHNITFHYVPTPPFATIASKIGYVNNSSETLGVSAAEETVMFVGAEANKNVTVRGDDAWQLDYRFSQRVVKDGANTYGWNHFWIPKHGWKRILSDDGDKPVYPSTTFAALFKNSG